MLGGKYFIFALIFIGYGIYSYNRKAVSFCVLDLLDEGLENDHIGTILSSQNLAYAISKFLGGILSDQLSSRILFSTGLLLSGISALFFSSFDTVLLFSLAWFVNGFAQGFGWPAIAKLLNAWFNPDELGTWWSLASASANLVGCFAPFVARLLISKVSWRFSILVAGSISIIASAFCYLFIRDCPHDQLKLKPNNKKKSEQDNKTKKKKNSTPNPISILLRSPSIWIISICYMVVSSLKTSLSDWSLVYLTESRQLSKLSANSFLGSIEFGGFFGGIAAGYLSDLYVKKIEHSARGNPRMTVNLLFSLLSVICLHILQYYVSAETSSIFLNQLGIWLGAAVYGQIAILGIVATQSVAKEVSGSSHAIAALTANLGSIIAGLPFATVAKHYSWSDVFLGLEFLSLATFILMILTRNINYRVEFPKAKVE